MSFVAEAVGGVVNWVTEAGTDLFDWGDWSEDSGYDFGNLDYLDADDADLGLDLLGSGVADEAGNVDWFNEADWSNFNLDWAETLKNNPDLVNSLADETEIPTSTGFGGFNIPGAAKNVVTNAAKNAAKAATASVLGGSGSGSGGSGGSGSSGSGSGGNPLLDAVVLSQLLQKPPSIVQPADNTDEIVAYNPYDTGLEDNLLPTGEKKDKDKTDEILAALGGIRTT